MPFRHRMLQFGRRWGETLNGAKAEVGAPTVAIWEPAWGGHHLFYVSLLIQELIARGQSAIWMHSGSAVESQDYELQLKPVMQSPLATDVSVTGAPSVGDLQQRAEQLGARRLILVDADVLLPHLLTLPRSRLLGISALISRDPALEIATSRAKSLRPLVKASLIHAVHACKRGINLRLLASPYSNSARVPRLTAGIPRAIDPVVFETDPGLVKWIKDTYLNDNRIWLTITGRITSRKGVHLAIEALTRVQPQRYGLFLAGSVSPEYRNRLEAQARPLIERGLRLRWLDRDLSNAEMSAAIQAADANLVLYSTPNPPSTLGKALSAGTLSIVAGPQHLRAYARAFPEGAWQCAPTPEQIARALGRLAPGQKSRSYRLPGADDFVQALLQ